MTNAAETVHSFYVIVKRAQGRTWYRTDSVSSPNLREVVKWMMAMPPVPSLVYSIGRSDQTYKMAPAAIRRDIDEYGK